MIDIQVKNLTKFFVIGENLLEGLSFEVQEGECVAILGRNGCGKTTLFKILTGETDYDDGEVYVNPNKRLGLISQIPVFPAGYRVEDVLRSAYAQITAAKRKMEELEKAMATGASDEQLREYDAMEAQAHALAAQRGWELPELDPAVKFMSDMMTRMQLGLGRSDTKIAELMIKGNTKGLTKQLHNSHILRHTDQPINDLNQKLLDSERANIRQIQGFV